MARVAGGDPDSSRPGTGPTSGRWSWVAPKIPAQRCRRAALSPANSAAKMLELVLDRLRDGLLARELGVEALVAPAAEDESRVRCLLPVIESPARVVRARDRASRASGSVAITWPRTGLIARRARAAGRSCSRRWRSRPGRRRGRRAIDARLFDDLGPGRDRRARRAGAPSAQAEATRRRGEDRARKSRSSGGRKLVDSTRPRSRPRGAPRTPRGGRPAPRRRPQPEAPDSPERVAGELLHPIQLRSVSARALGAALPNRRSRPRIRIARPRSANHRYVRSRPMRRAAPRTGARAARPRRA